MIFETVQKGLVNRVKFRNFVKNRVEFVFGYNGLRGTQCRLGEEEKINNEKIPRRKGWKVVTFNAFIY